MLAAVESEFFIMPTSMCTNSYFLLFRECDLKNCVRCAVGGKESGYCSLFLFVAKWNFFLRYNRSRYLECNTLGAHTYTQTQTKRLTEKKLRYIENVPLKCDAEWWTDREDKDKIHGQSILFINYGIQVLVCSSEWLRQRICECC